MKADEFVIRFEYKEQTFTGKVRPYIANKDKFKIKFEGYNIPIDLWYTENTWKGQWIGDQELLDTIGEAILKELEWTGD
jgi:hypothetical protein